MSGLEDTLDLAEEAYELKKPEVLDAERKRQKEFNEKLRYRSVEQPRYRRAEQPGEVISGIMPWYAIPLMLIFGLGTATIGAIVVPYIYLIIYSIISIPPTFLMNVGLFAILFLGLGFVIGQAVALGAEKAKNRNYSLRGIIGFISGFFCFIILNSSILDNFGKAIAFLVIVFVSFASAASENN